MEILTPFVRQAYILQVSELAFVNYSTSICYLPILNALSSFLLFLKSFYFFSIQVFAFQFIIILLKIHHNWEQMTIEIMTNITNLSPKRHVKFKTIKSSLIFLFIILSHTNLRTPKVINLLEAITLAIFVFRLLLYASRDHLDS